MGINYKGSIKVFGAILMVLGISMTLPIIVSLAYQDYNSAKVFSYVFIPCFLVGLLLLRLINTNNYRLNVRDGAFIVSISWFICSLIGALPFYISGSIPNFLDAFFETTSGFTTTGATILTDIEALPKPMLFWRAFTHWLGGMGILQFTIALLPILGMAGQQVAAAEIPGPTLAKITPKLSDTAQYLYILYFAFTVIETILLKIGGMSLFDAMCHSFSSLGTGGFTNYNDSIGHFNSFYIELVLMVFMFLSAMNFNLFFLAIRDGIKTFIKDGEWKLYVLVILGSSTLIALNLISQNQYSVLGAFRTAFFHGISILTTTGFVTDDYGLWPYFAQMCLFLLLFIGGCTSSTSGGIKCMRILVLLKLVKRNLAVRLHPNAVIQVRVNDQLLSKDTVSSITNFVFAYLGIGMVLGFLVSFDGYDFATNISSVFTCLSNTGPGFSALGPSFNFSIFSDFSKIVFSFAMIAGRLEIFTLLMLFSRKFWNPHH